MKKINVILAATLCISGDGFCQIGKKQTKKPNIIIILADDLGYGDLSCYGQKKFKTPNIDRLAAEGIRFTQFYAGCAVSAPSRSCLMTGQHNGHTPIRGNKEYYPEGQRPLPTQSITLAEVLKGHGYVTGAFGKWGLGYPGSEGDPINQGFDEFFGHNCQRMAHNYYPYHLWHNQTKVMLKENEGNQEGVYAPNLIHQKAMEFIEKNKDTSFFLYYATTIPHAELFAPTNKIAAYRNKLLPEKSYVGIDSGAEYRNGGYGSQPEAHAAFAAMVTLLDEQVGEIIFQLKKLGIENNTIIMFTSDNGPHLEGGADPDYFNSNGSLKGYKRDLYEGGIRVPFIVNWKGEIKPGQTSNFVAAFWDIMPTCSELAKIKTPSGIDGFSIVPTLMGKKQKQHEYLYWEFHELGGRIALRMGKWKAVKYNVNQVPKGEIELYDLDRDNGETKSLSKEYPEIVKKMEKLMIQAHTSSDIFKFGESTVIE